MTLLEKDSGIYRRTSQRMVCALNFNGCPPDGVQVIAHDPTGQLPGSLK